MCPRGVSLPTLYGSPRKKKNRPAMTSAARHLAQIEQLDAEFQQPRINQLSEIIAASRSHQATTSSAPEDQNPEDPNPFESPQHYNDEWHEHGEDFAAFHPHHMPAADYGRRKIQEEEHWNEVLHPMFLTYMRCAMSTSQWGDETQWNRDWTTECVCTPAQKKEPRPVDVVDILTRRKIQISFCECIPDQVRLIGMGYIGGSPKTPRTAFSIRLLNLFNWMWKFCAVRKQPFCLALDSFLDAHSPLILVKGTVEPRQWRRTFSSAVDAHHRILTMADELTNKALDLSPIEQLSLTCPRCFGPATPNNYPNEPDFIVCLDGNFQHRRHLASSHEIPQIKFRTPSLFLDRSFVDSWKPESARKPGPDEPLDPCTQQHTAASDKRGATTWKGCDETGLFGMVCRHDVCLAFIDVVQSGEKSYFAHAMIDTIIDRTTQDGVPQKHIGVLYDIGCTLRKGIIKNNLFNHHRVSGLLKIGTSAWHALVHSYTCQLEYNPRMNIGFGRTDGEGGERLWDDLSPLVSSNRYATSQHRADAINEKTVHHNDIRYISSARTTNDKLSKVTKTYNSAMLVLDRLRAPTQNAPLGLREEDFAAQWEKKRNTILATLADGSAERMRQTLGQLIELEEKLREAHTTLTALQNRRRRGRRSQEELNQLVSLPNSIVIIEQAIERVTTELGGDEFRDLPGITDPDARKLIQIRVAKEKLYEAKVGVLELMREWHQPGIGTRAQQHFKQLMQGKQKVLKSKWMAYNRQVSNYNSGRRIRDQLHSPTFEQVKQLPIEDGFWDIGHLTHPDEAWAVDRDTREGIDAYLTVRGCREEFRRISREVRQMLRSALVIEQKLNALLELIREAWVPGSPNGYRVIRMVQVTRNISRGHWKESHDVLLSLHTSLLAKHCRTWIRWNALLPKLMLDTRVYADTTPELDEELLNKWDELIIRGLNVWDKMVGHISVPAEDLDDIEQIEQVLGVENVLEDVDAHDLQLSDSEVDEVNEPDM